MRNFGRVLKNLVILAFFLGTGRASLADGFNDAQQLLAVYECNKKIVVVDEIKKKIISGSEHGSSLMCRALPKIPLANTTTPKVKIGRFDVSFYGESATADMSWRMGSFVPLTVQFSDRRKKLFISLVHIGRRGIGSEGDSTDCESSDCAPSIIIDASHHIMKPDPIIYYGKEGVYTIERTHSELANPKNILKIMGIRAPICDHGYLYIPKSSPNLSEVREIFLKKCDISGDF